MNKNSSTKKKHTPTKKGTTPRPTNLNKKKRIKATKLKITKTAIDLAEDKIQTKVFKNIPLTVVEENMLKIISKNYLEKNKNYIKHHWDIELETYLNMDYSPKKHFLIKAKIKHAPDSTWIATALAEAHIQSVFNEDIKEKVLFKSGRMKISSNLENMIISLSFIDNNGDVKNTHTKKYTLEDLPLFKTVVETMKT